MSMLPARPSGRSYWMLMASLPHLPSIERATRLPIGPERLEARLQMLEPADLSRLHHVFALLAWRRPAGDEGRDAAAWCEQARHWQATEPDAGVRALVVECLGRRSLLAALRRRRAGRPAPGVHEAWGVGPWGDKVRRSWAEPHFGLAHRLPWLVQAHERLEQGNALGLQTLLDRLDWAAAERLRQLYPVAFSAVLAYRLQWGVLQARLRGDPAVARDRLRALAGAALSPASQEAGSV